MNVNLRIGSVPLVHPRCAQKTSVAVWTKEKACLPQYPFVCCGTFWRLCRLWDVRAANGFHWTKVASVVEIFPRKNFPAKQLCVGAHVAHFFLFYAILA